MLSALLLFLALASWGAMLYLMWIIMDIVHASQFMYMLFGIWIVFGLIIQIARDKLQKMEFEETLKNYKEQGKL